MDSIEQLEKMASLKERGILTEDEYQAQKARLLNQIGAPSVTQCQPISAETDTETLIRRIADYERISAILWMVLGIIQICSVYGIIAGVWNIFASISRFTLIKRIRARELGVPKAYEGITQLVIIGLVNLFLGGVIGVLFVAFDFYVRDQVLKNAHLFNCAPASQNRISTSNT